MSNGDDSIYVNYMGVSNVGDALADATNQINTMFEDLMAACQPLVQTWSGTPQQQWTVLQNQWNTDIQNMQGILSKYNSTLDQMSVNYSSTDNQLANSWAGIN
jgi:WXG100 family type VII secretion target